MSLFPKTIKETGVLELVPCHAIITSAIKNVLRYDLSIGYKHATSSDDRNFYLSRNVTFDEVIMITSLYTLSWILILLAH